MAYNFEVNTKKLPTYGQTLTFCIKLPSIMHTKTYFRTMNSPLFLIILSLLLAVALSTEYTGSDIVITTAEVSNVINCDAGTDCTIHCNGTGTCDTAQINCPKDANCDIRCSGDASCQSADFTCPSSKNTYCTIDCGYDLEACDLTYMNATFSRLFALHCHGKRGCASSVIDNEMGGINSSMTVNLSVASGTESSVISAAWETFSNTAFLCPIEGDCTFTIGTVQTAFGDGATVYANYSNDVVINCADYDSFTYTNFDILNDWSDDIVTCSSLVLYAQEANIAKFYGGPGAFEACQFHCPNTTNERGYSCELYGIRPLGNWTKEFNISYGDIIGFATFTDVEIISYEGFNDIGLFCDEKVEEFYGESNVDWFLYDEQANDNFEQNYIFNTWVLPCVDTLDITCSNRSYASLPDQDHCWLALVVPESYGASDYFKSLNNKSIAMGPTGMPTSPPIPDTVESKRWNQFDWICANIVGIPEFSNVFSYFCFEQDSVDPTPAPTFMPSVEPSNLPSTDPTAMPTNLPSIEPTGHPSSEPTAEPSNLPTTEPSIFPTEEPGMCVS